jgi:transposase
MKKKEKTCSICGETKKELRKNGFDIDLVFCEECKNWYCEACLIEVNGGYACPKCSDIHFI